MEISFGPSPKDPLFCLFITLSKYPNFEKDITRDADLDELIIVS